MTAVAFVAALVCGFTAAAILGDWFNRPAVAEADHDAVVAWCHDCAEPITGVVAHYASRHPGRDLRCVTCARDIPTDLWDAHQRLSHQPRAMGLEDLWSA